MEVSEMVALWHLELLPGLVTLLLTTFGTKEDRRNRQHRDNDLEGEREREDICRADEDAPLIIK